MCENIHFANHHLGLNPTSTHVPHRPSSSSSTAIKFALPPAKIPTEKCMEHSPPTRLRHRHHPPRPRPQPTRRHRHHRLHTLVKHLNKGIDGEICVCFKNYLAQGRSSFFRAVWSLEGYGLNVKRRGQDGDFMEHDAHDRPRY